MAASSPSQFRSRSCSRCPDAGFLPVAQPPPAGRPAAAAQLLREQPPRAAGPEDEDDTGQGGAVRHAGAAALRLGRLSRQEGLDGLPEVVGTSGALMAEKGRATLHSFATRSKEAQGRQPSSGPTGPPRETEFPLQITSTDVSSRLSSSPYRPPPGPGNPNVRVPDVLGDAGALDRTGARSDGAPVRRWSVEPDAAPRIITTPKAERFRAATAAQPVDPDCAGMLSANRAVKLIW
jgi:hypothetical protein